MGFIRSNILLRKYKLFILNPIPGPNVPEPDPWRTRRPHASRDRSRTVLFTCMTTPLRHPISVPLAHSVLVVFTDLDTVETHYFSLGRIVTVSVWYRRPRSVLRKDPETWGEILTSRNLTLSPRTRKILVSRGSSDYLWDTWNRGPSF